MVKMSENETPSLLFLEGAAPSTPAAAQVKLYAKADGLLYSKDDAGVETALGVSGGGAGDMLAANNLSDVASAATARTNLGVGTGDSPQFTGLNVGHASDTTVTRDAAGDLAVEGNRVYRAGGTDVPVTDGGTGSSTASGARTNLGLGTVAVVDLDTDTTLAANSDAKVASQKAVKAYVDAAVTGLLDFKGSTDCSANPNYPAALKGDAYVVTVAGKIGGASGTTVEVGDVYVASADNAGGTQAGVGTSWFLIEHNLQGAVLTGGALGTPSSGTLTNCGGLPAGTGLTGQTPIANGGTGASSASAAVDALGGASSSGTGGLARLSGATFVAPILGTPASVNLSNGTALPLAGHANLTDATLMGNLTGGAAAPQALARGSISAIVTGQAAALTAIPCGMSVTFSGPSTQNTTTALRYAQGIATFSQFVVPQGWKFLVLAASAHAASAIPAAQTCDLKLYVSTVDQSANFGTWRLDNTHILDSVEPSTPGTPYVIDATGGDVVVEVRSLNSATTGTINIAATLFGILIRP